MTKRKAKQVDARPCDFQTFIRDLGLTTVCYLNIAVECADGINRWLPRDIIGDNGKSLIIYRTANDGNYSIAGWEPWHDGVFGGRYENISSALWWIKTAIAVRAGRVADFRGA